MIIEMPKIDKMTNNGSYVLKSLQNKEMPLLDLLVRESIQNSLDAASPKAKRVRVAYAVGTFSNEKLSPYFDTITDKLNRRYGNKEVPFISIKDDHTTGLTGPVRYDDVRNDDYGNLIKLVYDIGKEQQAEGAGGSWGLGKTIYYRLGIGLVIYYSRIKTDNGFQSRLVACLVENEKLQDTLLKKSDGINRGIAWWGKEDSRNPGKAIPVTNVKEIERLLDVFGLQLYAGNETGTTIIIPYLKDQQLLNELFKASEENPFDNRPYWVKSIPEYLDVAVQKWYAPRLMNEKGRSPYLQVSINGKRIEDKAMLPTFKIVKELYNYALSEGDSPDPKGYLAEKGAEPHKEEITTRRVLEKSSAGVLAYVKLTDQQLGMLPPDNERAPFQHISNKSYNNADGNVPIVLYTRLPGMIVGYDFDKEWSHGLSVQKPNEYVIAIFVLNSSNILKEQYREYEEVPLTLEEYVRKGEKADHAAWQDSNLNGENPELIGRIQSGVKKKINAQFKPREADRVVKQNVGLSSALADMLLPPQDFGNVPTPPATPPGGETPPRRKVGPMARFHPLGNPIFRENDIIIRYEIVSPGTPFELQIKIDTDFKKLDAATWEKEDEIGQAFPVEISEMKIEKIQKMPQVKRKGKIVNCYESNLIFTSENCEDSDQSISGKIVLSERFQKGDRIILEPRRGKCVISGTLTLSCDDKSIRYLINTKELK